jgi:MFS family permease
MTELLTVVAILAGLFAFGFGLAGILGLVDFEPTEERRPRLVFVLDQLVAGGIGTMLHDVGRNWAWRSTERRFVYVAIASGIVCVLMLTIRRFT